MQALISDTIETSTKIRNTELKVMCQILKGHLFIFTMNNNFESTYYDAAY